MLRQSSRSHNMFQDGDWQAAAGRLRRRTTDGSPTRAHPAVLPSLPHARTTASTLHDIQRHCSFTLHAELRHQAPTQNTRALLSSARRIDTPITHRSTSMTTAIRRENNRPSTHEFTSKGCAARGSPTQHQHDGPATLTAAAAAAAAQETSSSYLQ